MDGLSQDLMVGQDWLNLLHIHRIIAVIRTDSVAAGLEMAKAAAAGGLRLIEVTWNSDRPALLVETLRTELPHCTIGCGTLLTQDQIKDAILAGAQYGFMPHVDAMDVIADFPFTPVPSPRPK
jgi:2-dehydro-3-deoxyphosphogluconate aldolase / (4S)-4-hydroxy-2-oxoglutarate aldolase